jgi:menaquinone-dependent protoporphyrinogen oxidase
MRRGDLHASGGGPTRRTPSPDARGGAGRPSGQTRKIAGRIAETAGEMEHDAEVVDGACGPVLAPSHRYDAVVVAGSVHAGKHQRSLVRFVRASQPSSASRLAGVSSSGRGSQSANADP